MKALLLGSIGVLAETSELQRRAYNTAFVAHGVDWHWNIATYCRHLATPGGQHRLRQLGGDALSTIEIRRIHETKQDAFAASLAGGIAPRPGIVETLTAARAAGLRIGFVTTTTPRTIAMIREALSGHIDMSDFAVITSKEDVVREKPDGACTSWRCRASASRHMTPSPLRTQSPASRPPSRRASVVISTRGRMPSPEMRPCRPAIRQAL